MVSWGRTRLHFSDLYQQDTIPEAAMFELPYLLNSKELEADFSKFGPRGLVTSARRFQKVQKRVVIPSDAKVMAVSS